MLKFIRCNMDENYLRRWNSVLDGFVKMYNDDIKISDTLYRIPNLPLHATGKYSIILKYTEAYYDDKITKDVSRKPHLKCIRVIIDDAGNEVMNFAEFEDPYLCGGIIYKLESSFYNIKTGKLIIECYETPLYSKNYITLLKRYNKDDNLNGLYQININTGEITKIDDLF